MSMRCEFLKYSYEAINSDLKFAETKNTCLITFNAAILGIFVSLIANNNKQICLFQQSSLFIFLIFIFISTIISMFSFLPLNPINKIMGASNKITNNSENKFMFYSYNCAKYKGIDKYNKFETDIKTNCNDNSDTNLLEKQLARQIIDLSYIANTKFKLFSLSLKLEILSILPLFVFTYFIIFS